MPLARLFEEWLSDRGIAVSLLRLAGSRTFKSLSNASHLLPLASRVRSPPCAVTWMQNVALYWLILQHYALAASRSGCCRSRGSGPFIVLGLFSGVVADRFDNRRTVIVPTQSVQIGLLRTSSRRSPCLATSRPWEVYAIAALTGTAVVFDLPARQSLMVQLVGRDELPNAIALNSSLFNTARIIRTIRSPAS